MQSIADQFRVGRSTAGVIIKDTLKSIMKRLQPLIMPEPTTDSWLRSAEGFWKRWNFPFHCIGALDGTAFGSGSVFFNYKGFHSTVLMAVCDYRYRFMLVDIGSPGRQSDAGIFRNSVMGQRFEKDTMNVSPPQK
ncbi:hypothetical protein HA402_000538 [Bradysia odoriphaga]|nr:hypothetical protein HA402_000538 [Bradysia odoriphaga]